MSTYKDSSEAVMYDKNGLPIYGMDLELVCVHLLKSVSEIIIRNNLLFLLINLQ